MSRHDRNLKTEANPKAGKSRIADSGGTARYRVEGIDHTAADVREDGSEDDTNVEVAQFVDEDAGGDISYCLNGS